MQTLRDRTAVVTGAASGIGRAIALRLAGEGAHLYLIDVNEEGLENVAIEAARSGVQVLTQCCDLANSAQITTTAEDARSRCPSIDVLVNNAGIAYYGETAKMSAADASRLLKINLHAPIQLSRELLPTMLSQDEAHIVNVASFLGLIGTRRLALYTASKFGLVGFSESLRAEYARSGLGVSALCPGFVDTCLFESAALGDDREQPKLPPKWSLTTPERVADQAIVSIYRNRALSIPQLYARLAYLGKRLVPGVLDWANHLSRKKKNRQKSSDTEASLGKAA